MICLFLWMFLQFSGYIKSNLLDIALTMVRSCITTNQLEYWHNQPPTRLKREVLLKSTIVFDVNYYSIFFNHQNLLLNECRFSLCTCLKVQGKHKLKKRLSLFSQIFPAYSSLHKTYKLDCMMPCKRSSGGDVGIVHEIW